MGPASKTQRSIEEADSPIPVVDFVLWLESNDIEQRLKVAKSLVEACQKAGFVYITNHGLPDDDLQEAFGWSEKLFDLGSKEKNLAPHPPGGQESYEFGSEGLATQPNVFFPESVLPGFRAWSLSFYWRLNEIAQSIIKALTVGIGLQEDYITRYHSSHNNQLRLLHYPPAPATLFESQQMARMPTHSDLGSITLLFQDDCGGLEVEDPHREGKFVPVTPLKGAKLVNVGDLLMRWSNDTLKSMIHRVTLPPLSDRFQGEERLTRARYSIPYFMSHDPEAVVQCLPACQSAERPAKYEPINWESYRLMRAKLHYRAAGTTVE